MDKLLTMVMGVKGRPERAMKSIQSIVSPESAKLIDFIIVEDVSERRITGLEPFQGCSVSHYVIDTGVSWSRSKVLNFGFKRAKTKFVGGWDSDFLFPADFPTKITGILADFKEKHILKLHSRETDDCYIDFTKYAKGQIYGGIYFYSTENLHAVHGFDEDYLDWGKEERDFENRYLRYTHGIQVTNQTLEIQHLSHGDHIRRITDETERNKKRERESRSKRYEIVANGDSWGNQTVIQHSVY